MPHLLYICPIEMGLGSGLDVLLLLVRPAHCGWLWLPGPPASSDFIHIGNPGCHTPTMTGLWVRLPKNSDTGFLLSK